MLLRNYLETFQQALERLRDYGYTEAVEFKEEMRARKQAVIKAKIILVDNSVFHIQEYIDAKYTIDKVSYSYQYLDRDGKLIFRYDNALHKPALRCKSHKHTRDGTIICTHMPEISNVIDEIIKYL